MSPRTWTHHPLLSLQTLMYHKSSTCLGQWDSDIYRSWMQLERWVLISILFWLSKEASVGFCNVLTSNRNALKRSEWDLLKSLKHCWLLWLIFCVEACFLLSLQRAGHAVSPLSQVCSMWKPLLSCTSWDALSSSEAANLASSLTALCKAKSRISCVLGQEVFLLEGNLHSVPTHRSSKIKESEWFVLDSLVLFSLPSTMLRNSQ